MKSKSPEDWFNAIQNVESSVRNAVAKIIWWDFFGDKVCTQRWNHLDSYINSPYEELDDNLIMEGLQVCGFTEKQAMWRVYPELRIKEQPTTNEIK